MRQADAGGKIMKNAQGHAAQAASIDLRHWPRLAPGVLTRVAPYVIVLLGCAPAFAAITGAVVNRTTGQPQAGATVSLLRMGQNGPEPAGDVKADAQGKFSFEGSVQGPTLVRATIDGVTYNKVLVPGTPSENITLDIYNASRQPGDAKVSKHMILFQPNGQELVVNEAYIVSNTGKTAWNDPADGTLHFFVPEAAKTTLEVNATPPGGQPLKQAAEKVGRSDVYKLNFAMRPGETRVDLDYKMPYAEGAALSGKIVSGDENTYLIAPNGVTLGGDNLNDLGQEPRTQAHIYGVKGTSYEIKLTGAVAPSSADAGSDSAADSGQPPIQQIMPRLYTKVGLILGLALGILTLGFLLLYRMPAKETNERGRG
jgi:hypothetical protein